MPSAIRSYDRRPRPHAPVRMGVDKAGEGRIMRDRCKPFFRPTPSKGGHHVAHVLDASLQSTGWAVRAREDDVRDRRAPGRWCGRLLFPRLT